MGDSVSEKSKRKRELMGGSGSNSKGRQRRETRKQRRKQVARKPQALPVVPVNPFDGITTAWHLWEQIFLSSPVIHFEWKLLFRELPAYQAKRAIRMSR